MSTRTKVLIGIAAAVVLLAAMAPSEAAAEAMGTAIGSLLLFCGLGYVLLRRAR